MQEIIRSKIPRDEPPEEANVANLLIEALERHSHRTLLVDPIRDQQLTGSEILKQIKRIGTNFINGNLIKPNDLVLLLCDQNVEQLILAFGIIVSGASLYGLDVSDGFSEWLSYCQMIRPQVIIAKSSLQPEVRRLKQVLGSKELRLVWCSGGGAYNEPSLVDENNNSSGSIDSGLSCNNNYCDDAGYCCTNSEMILPDLGEIKGDIDEKLFEIDRLNGRINRKELAVTYVLTSGSTSKPKVVKLTHENLVYSHFSLDSATKYPLVEAGESLPDLGTARILPLDEGKEVYACNLPLDHGAGITTIILSLTKGFKMIVEPINDVDLFWACVAKYRVTSCITSTMYAYKLLLKLKELIEADDLQRFGGDLSSFRFLACCGSKVNYFNLIDFIRDSGHFKQLIVSQYYGATEIGYVAGLRLCDARTHLHSVGHLFPGMRAKVVEPNSGSLCGPNERGELRLWHESKFSQYRCLGAGSPEEERRIFLSSHDEENFYKTGDQVHYDQWGRFYVHGRFKDTLTLWGEWKILPAELEELISEHPLVETAIVVGIPDASLPGCDLPRAFVKLIEPNSRELKRLSEDSILRRKLIEGDLQFIQQDIYDFEASKTAEPKHLKGGVRIVSQFPRNGILNKIDRKQLQQMD